MTCAVSSHGSKLLPVRIRRPFSSSMLKVSNNASRITILNQGSSSDQIESTEINWILNRCGSNDR